MLVADMGLIEIRDILTRVDTMEMTDDSLVEVAVLFAGSDIELRITMRTAP